MTAKHMYRRFSCMIVLGLLFASLLSACQLVKPYQRVYLNDHEMQVGPRASQRQDANALTYREGSSGGGTGKVSGGCGCN